MAASTNPSHKKRFFGNHTQFKCKARSMILSVPFVSMMAIISLANLFFTISYIFVLDDGIQHGWPDAVVCNGKINAGDTYGTHVFYLVHHNQNGGSYYRLPPGAGLDGRVGNAPTIVFDQTTKAYKNVTDFNGNLDCQGHSIDDLVENRQAVFFITTPTDVRFAFFSDTIRGLAHIAR